ncbi:hypothetical protein GCK72_003316 [Caenorhabditis remanei]|uniref:Uncharacterized protein n=1 Tax=Caenorhabditis remanei TaxID=31234 RepID=A0A6A5HUN3_CAERE|nr:hypothetical protein GCK72_003316 [Caenorhabditis remanei]KAF1771489.1 hypothetical protein GCK72_003316 [Caenorhabditis remanei]
MNPLLILFLLVAVSTADYTPLSYEERPCGTDMSNLWLDVVAVVDNSKVMGDEDLAETAVLITRIFGESRIGTSIPNQPKTTRLGLVTYNSTATIQAGLDKFQSQQDVIFNIFNSLNAVSSTSESYLANGLVAAENVFAKGPSRGNNYQKVILLFAASYSSQSNPIAIANRLKQAGITIITMGYNNLKDPNFYQNLVKIASPNKSIASIVSVPIDFIQEALLDSNCFCPPKWAQYYAHYTYLGECIIAVPNSTVWNAAHLSCQNLRKNAYMVNEYSQEKHDFVLRVVKSWGFPQPYTYFTGLAYSNKGKWQWDQPAGWPQPALQQWFNWDQGYPMSASNMGVVQNVQKGESTVWRNFGQWNTAAPYICEVAACDTDTYCDENFQN